MTAPRPFSPTIPHFQTTWDSTSLGWLKDCPRMYQYMMLEQWSPKSKGIHLAFGGWYARGVELYARWRAEGMDHDPAVEALVAWALEATGDRDEDGTWHPWESGDPIKNRYTLIRSLVWNVEDRLTSPWKTHILANGKPAVELTFNFEVFEVAGHTISLSGHMDEILYNTQVPNTKWVKDDKTTKGPLDARYFQQYSPHNQMSLYSVAGRVILSSPVAGVLIRAAQIGAGFTRFNTQQVPRPTAVLDEWLADTKRWVELAHQYAVAGHWPMNDKSCDKFGGCPFRKVCGVSPSHRKSWLEADFERREWNPLSVRGEE